MREVENKMREDWDEDDMRMGSNDIYQMITHIERANDYRKPTIRKNLPVGYWRKQMLEHLGGVEWHLHVLYDNGIIEYSRYSDIREKTVKLIEQVKDLPEGWDMMTPDEKITDFVDFQLLEKLRRLVGNVYFDFVRELI